MERIIIDGLSFSLPLFIMAIGGIYCERSGVINLALEGFQGIGAFSGALAAVLLMQRCGLSADKAMYFSFIFAIAGAAVYSAIHALLSIKFKANQVISGVVLNILALSLTIYLTKVLNKTLFRQASDKFVLTVSERFNIPYISDIPLIGAFFREIYPFEIIVLLLAVIFWYILYKTHYGMLLRACGDNPQAVDAAGKSVAFVRTIAVLISGALSGIAGICFSYSISGSFSSSSFVGYGYLSIAAMIFGNWKILPTIAACLLFGFARSGGYFIVQKMSMPASYSDLAMTLPYVMTLLLLLFFSKYNHAPRALGETYDKGKR
ncbi:ABC transporter permease [Amygdalobacter indicium]|jgi:hypothetical protein|uniref:ABC transporter permease n=1 Tax=Amygdalobacter indicium TaxID=3029272 RepID=A0ABY8C9H1_9FIRM|nr:ABC transporter permease [Amygdalobacter indicium]WEG36174.1 ABC transporter permease [Amygdalobacter indicium]